MDLLQEEVQVAEDLPLEEAQEAENSLLEVNIDFLKKYCHLTNIFTADLRDWVFGRPASAISS